MCPCRYETTRALPVEYGAVNAVSAFSGLIFYREASAMAPAQLTTMVVGVGAILAGIAIGNLEPPAMAALVTSDGPTEGDKAGRLELTSGL